MKFSITDQYETSTPWVETHAATTDKFGLFRVVIGQGTKIGGTAATFSVIDWKAYNYYVKIEIQQGIGWFLIGKEPLMSVPYAALAKEAINTVPPGTIVPFAGPNLPSGWLFCDGSELLQTDFPELYASIGTSWGSSDLLLKFRLPDLRGLFMRGKDNMDNNVGIGGGDAGRDPDKSTRSALYANGDSIGDVGSYQNDAFQKHQHRIPLAGSGANTFVLTAYSTGNGSDLNNMKTSNLANDDSVGNFKSSSETRPKNVYVNYIIKY